MKQRLLLPDAETLRIEFSYDPETGHLSSIQEPNPKWGFGPIMSRSTSEYLVVTRHGVTYYQHRLIWKLMTGQEPPAFIDHVNQDRADNRWVNLREADLVTNAWNSKPRSHNKSGFRGVTFHKKQRVWHANIKYDGVRHYLGQFETAEEAAAAFDAVAVQVSRGFYAPAITGAGKSP